MPCIAQESCHSDFVVPNPEILGTSGAAARLDVCERRVQQLADAGLLRAMRTDRGVRVFFANEVDALAGRRAAERAAREASR
jgi:hypothetical protein